MVYEWKSQLAKASWCQRESWRNLLYMGHIAILRVRQWFTLQSRSHKDYL